ncbi:hypothetical protein C6P40_003389 [Pichia californica]|uniref:J domain-containing protein n=1 Tax=Pichia californica TaxID=460514 RepID=A0A9P7BHB1_9ASCO|nr:hypothetical protein C6P42_004453 [[Candida] californica]KAG0690275.1 hypothetical protein C6P40_003389 [[Candida] californica]
MSIEEEIEKIDPYKVLGVDEKADTKEIKRSYHKLCLKYHPDKNEGFRKEFDQVQVSYMVLSDEKKRSRYDRTGIINLKDDFEEGDEEGFNWNDYFKTQFESISKEMIEKDREEYQGSSEEEEDIRNELINSKGDLNKLFESVIHLEFTLEEEKRVFNICKKLIDQGDIEMKDIPKWERYVSKRKENIKKNEKKRIREEKEAEKVSKGDEEKDMSLVGLQALIANNASRHRDFAGTTSISVVLDVPSTAAGAAAGATSRVSLYAVEVRGEFAGLRGRVPVGVLYESAARKEDHPTTTATAKSATERNHSLI